MRLWDFIVIRLTLCLVVGILIGYFYPFDIPVISAILIFLTIFIFLLLLRLQKHAQRSILFGVLTFMTFIVLGIFTVSVHNQRNLRNHYTVYIKDIPDYRYKVALRIQEILKPNYHERYVVEILSVDNFTTSGKSILNIKKDGLDSHLKVDDVLITKTNFLEILPPLNPSQFDYKSYLEQRYIYHQIYSHRNELYRLPLSHKTISGTAAGIRGRINNKLKTYHFSPDELAVINALLLGQRRDLSEEVYNNYTNAGAIHILAVSGLHIGIIFLIINFLLKPLEKLKRGKFVKSIIVLIILWCFAVMAGLSASVTRAVTMFSVIAIAMNLKRPTNIYNTIAVSIFILLLFKPLLLFDVGFQLSYAAVLGIVIIDPILYKKWEPHNRILDFYWHTLSITIAAQIGILPLSLYYFHQFPALFFITNLIIIPFLGCILGFGILTILLAILNLLPNFLAELFGFTIHLLNEFVAWIASQKSFVLEDIPFTLAHVISIYFIIIFFYRYALKRNYYNLTALLISIIFLQGVLIYNGYSNHKNQFVIFQKVKGTIIGNRSHEDLVVSINIDSIEDTTNRIIRDYKIGNEISDITIEKLKPLYFLNEEKLLVIDSLGIYSINKNTFDYVLLRQSPKINLERVIDSINPKLIIADGSNYKSYIALWKQTTVKRKISFHNTNEKGALIIDY